MPLFDGLSWKIMDYFRQRKCNTEKNCPLNNFLLLVTPLSDIWESRTVKYFPEGSDTNAWLCSKSLIQPRSKETHECEWVEFLAYQCLRVWGVTTAASPCHLSPVSSDHNLTFFSAFHFPRGMRAMAEKWRWWIVWNSVEGSVSMKWWFPPPSKEIYKGESNADEDQSKP